MSLSGVAESATTEEVAPLSSDVEMLEENATLSSVSSADGALSSLEGDNTLPPGEKDNKDDPKEESGEGSRKDSKDNAKTETKDENKPKPVRPNQETLHTPVFPSDIIEYEWPLKSSERYFLQEQIAELLDVKSFKRKYPDLTRRIVEVPEKEYLMKNHNLMKTIGEHRLFLNIVWPTDIVLYFSEMHGLTALRSIEVHELMATEYPSIYSEYQKAATEKVKVELFLRQKELDAIKNDEKKLKELREKAMRSSAEYNADIAVIKRTERAYYWDLQTSIIQSPAGKWYKLPKEKTRSHPYPCTIVHGQYQQYYKKWTRNELRCLPLSTVLDGSHLFTVVRPASPPPIVLSEEDMAAAAAATASAVATSASAPSDTNSPSPSGEAMPHLEEAVPSRPRSGACSLCGQTPRQVAGPMLKCASCSILVHADCIDMPDRMVEVVQGYQWNCIECKKCTVCAQPDAEESMMFCDRCDRGYHTFCVGLQEPPTGAWMCGMFCNRGEESKDNIGPLASAPLIPIPDSTEEKTRVVKMERSSLAPPHPTHLPSTPSIATRASRSTRRNSQL